MKTQNNVAIEEKIITVLIVDDHAQMREGLGWALQTDARIEVTGNCEDGINAIDLYLELKPDVVLMELSLKPTDGFTASAKILEADPNARIIGLSTHETRLYANRFLKLGGRGYITKTSSFQEIIKAIHLVDAGQTYICEELKNRGQRQKLLQDSLK